MFHFVINKVRRYPVSLLLIACIWFLCFCTVPRTPLDNVSFIDKWVHITMYFTTCFSLWVEYLRAHNHPKEARLLIYAWVAPIIMSGVIELLQAYCTGGRRSGDWLDFAANSTGATLAMIIGLALMKVWRRR